MDQDSIRSEATRWEFQVSAQRWLGLRFCVPSVTACRPPNFPRSLCVWPGIELKAPHRSVTLLYILEKSHSKIMDPTLRCSIIPVGVVLCPCSSVVGRMEIFPL